jgi:hypothetical protein
VCGLIAAKASGSDVKTDELGRLAVRMILGRDPDEPPRRR